MIDFEKPVEKRKYDRPLIVSEPEFVVPEWDLSSLGDSIFESVQKSITVHGNSMCCFTDSTWNCDSS